MKKKSIFHEIFKAFDEAEVDMNKKTKQILKFLWFVFCLIMFYLIYKMYN
jgi:hypothetical protein